MQFGDYRVEIVPDTEFRLDGGAMFGVVPRNLWSRLCAPDEQNRILMNMNCLFIERGDERILIDTGMGEKWSEKQNAIYAITRRRSLGDSLRAITGYVPEEITIVINTHLHFDHAGGNTRLNEEGQAVPAFPNARYFVSCDEFEYAEAPTERDRASYRVDDWRPLQESGQLELKEPNYEVVPGLHLETQAGHNRSMQCVRLEQGDDTFFGFADLIPMQAHLSLAWIMGFDLYPLETLAAKKKLLPTAAAEGWTCLFYHDPHQPLARVIEAEGKFKAVPLSSRS